MADYPFNLKGHQVSARNNGNQTGEKFVSQPFELRQGLAIIEINHPGYGDFKFEIIPTEGIRPGEAEAASTAGTIGTAFLTGAAVGSIVPGIGTIVGGIAGGVAGYFAGQKAGDFIADKITPITYKVEANGEYNNLEIFLVSNNEEYQTLRPKTYQIEVSSTSKWECQIIQPDLSQSHDIFEHCPKSDRLQEPTLLVAGPFKVPNPVIAHIIKEGHGGIIAEAFSLDGTHSSEIYYEEGQFVQNDIRTDLRVGKEYMLYLISDGPWDLWFTEGY